MIWLWLLPLLGGLALVAGCLYVLIGVRRMADEVDGLASDIGVADAAAPPNLAGADGLYLTVQILNPIEVACSNSRLAGPISGISPGLLCRQVYDQMSSELSEQLSDHGIEAEIDVARGQS